MYGSSLGYRAFGKVVRGFLQGYTARSRKDQTRNAHRGGKQNPEWSLLVSFRTARLDRDLNFDHSGFRFASMTILSLTMLERAVCKSRA